MAAPTTRTTTQGIELTPSVDSAIARLSGNVTSWDVVKTMLELHPEYGRNKGRDVIQREGPPRGVTQPPEGWLNQVGNLFDTSQVKSLHGRLLILGLCHLESEKDLSDYLRGTGFLAALQDELREDFLSLLTPEAAGAEAYRGEFIRILQNRGKRASGGVQRSSGFLITAKGGPRLDALAELPQRQTYNRCFTARYVLPSGAGFAHGLHAFAQDVNSLAAGGTIEGDLLPDPTRERQAWHFLLSEPVQKSLAMTPTQRELAAEALLASIHEAFSREDVLGVGMRLILLFEFRAVREGANPDNAGLSSSLVSALGQLPERLGMVFSGLPDSVTRHLTTAFTIELPPDPELTRGLAPSNDVPAGPDLLGIDTEVRALAEAIALKEMSPPLVVGVLGGWGAGKSFVLHLLEERLQEIRCERVPEPSSDGTNDGFPFVGHPYVIRFDAWTYAKGNLWASLMQTIFLELQRQIGLEQVLQEKAGLSLRDETEIWRVLSRLRDEQRERLTRTDLGLKALQFVRQFDQGAISERSLWEALEGFRAKERRQLQSSEKRAASLQREVDGARRLLEDAVDQRLAARARGRAWKELATNFRDRLSATLRQRVEAEAKKRGREDVPDANDLRAAVKWYWKLWLGRGPAFYAFLVFAAVALAVELGGLVTIPLPSGLTSALSGLGAVVVALLKGYDWLEKRRAEFTGLIERERPSQERSREELIAEALAAAEEGAGTGPPAEAEAEAEPEAEGEAEPEARDDRDPIARLPDVQGAAAELARLQGDLRVVQAEVEAQRQRAGITARHASLLDFVRQRLEGRYYEDKLGLLHQVQSDLEELSTALLPSQARRRSLDTEHIARLEKLFPRGDPRIILIIDDLDRCPPTKVVQVLEAAQLLVKTPLFVVVLAMDVRYITRALEKQYDRVLVRGGEPSGLDYIEKIIQIPYRVRVITPPVVGGFLSSQMQLEQRVLQPASNISPDEEIPADEEVEADAEAGGAIPTDAEKQKGERSGVTPARPVRSELRVLPTEVLRFNEHDHRVISLCCSAVDVSPRAMKRLVNVYKLLKIIWFRQGLTDGPPEPVKRAMLALLVLAARYPEVVRQLLRHVEEIYRQGGKPVDLAMAPELAERCRRSEATALYPPDWAHVRTALLDEKLFPTDLTFRQLEEANFQLVNSFCFVSETDPEREAALLWGARRADGSAVRSPGQANREGDPKEAGDAQPAP